MGWVGPMCVWPRSGCDDDDDDGGDGDDDNDDDGDGDGDDNHRRRRAQLLSMHLFVRPSFSIHSLPVGQFALSLETDWPVGFQF